MGVADPQSGIRTVVKLSDYKPCQSSKQEGPPTPEVAMSDVYCLIACGHITRARDLASKLFEHFTAPDSDDRQALIALGMRHALDGVLAYKAQSKRSR